jgi:CheY-like chemotaxis protein
MSTILCVDDNPGNLCLVSTLFEMEGYNVLSTSDPRNALDLAKSTFFELAVLDYDLPHINGAELARELKRIQPDVPIILFSGSLSITAEELTVIDEHVCKGETSGTLLLAASCLLKPRTRARACGKT